ncbi:MAG: type II secretion system F family protein [Verrucomicrobiota bacterium]|jgi:type IV pilus assembly protein PilC|nr:type II secretion system F family protein [Verrucomicrobiota bacterium]MDD8052277.1 type II secretion system F family protein [Verrucomicrobiota bacterium]HCF95820.1 pilus assembly protein PilC [Verrucomicrobiota bacterium]
MAKFKYVAVDPGTNKETTGVVEAKDKSYAERQVKDMGFYPTSVTKVAEASKGGKGGKGGAKKGGALSMELKMPGGGKVKGKVLMLFTRQLATLIDAGLPLLRGLNVLGKQEKNPTLKRVTFELAEAVESGSTFSEALAQHPKVFNKLYVNMVRAGEIGGVMEVVLIRLAEFQEKAQKIRGKVKSAMVYPVVVLFMAVAILAFLMIFIIPKFKEIFDDLLEGQELPGLTKFVMACSDAVRTNFPAVAATVVAIVIALKMFGKTALGRKLIDQVVLYIPIFGSLLRKVAISRFARTLGTLISSGVPILQSLTIVRETAGNQVVADAISNVHESIKEGDSMVGPLEQSKVFPPMVVSMIDVGEETGALPEMLLKVADVYDDEVDNAVEGMTSLLEPIMIIFLALIVGSIVIAMFMPLVKIIESLS